MNETCKAAGPRVHNYIHVSPLAMALHREQVPVVSASVRGRVPGKPGQSIVAVLATASAVP